MKLSCRHGIIGAAVGDALGVPVEFKPRGSFTVTGMQAGQKPAGTWSDDTSMILATMDAFTNDGAEDACMQNFCAWLYEGKYTSDGDVFDVGITTSKALENYHSGKPFQECGLTAERDNGNGSLMRILPVVYREYAKYGKDAIGNPEVFAEIHNYSALTHAHPMSKMCCGMYATMAFALLSGMTPEDAFDECVMVSSPYYHENPEFRPYYQYFSRIFRRSLPGSAEAGIRSGGFAVDTLEAAIWVLLNGNYYEDIVLHAVNLGSDTDTTAAVAGGLAGIAFGEEAIPYDWIQELKGRETLDSLCSGFDAKFF